MYVGTITVDPPTSVLVGRILFGALKAGDFRKGQSPLLARNGDYRGALRFERLLCIVKKEEKKPSFHIIRTLTNLITSLIPPLPRIKIIVGR
jgi:hypothetical protein